VEYTTKRKFRAQDLQNETGYQASLGLIRAKAQRAEADAIETFQKKNKPKKTKDFTAEEVAADKFNIEQIGKLREADYQIDAENQKRIFEDTQQSLDKRLDAYREYANDLRLIVQITKNAEIAAVTDTLSTIKTLRAKQAAGGKLTPQQKKLVDQEAGFTAELERLAKERTRDLAKIETDGDKEIDGIRNSDVQKRLTVISEIRAAEQQDRDEDLRKNEQNFRNKEITYRTYKEREKAINDVSAAAEATAVVKYLQAQLDALQGNDKSTISLRKALNDALNALYKADSKNFDDQEAEKEARRKKFEAEIKNASINAAQTLADGVIAHQQRQIDKDNELAQTALDNQKRVAEAAAQSAEERAAIDAEFDQKSEALKRAQFEKNKDLSIKQLELDFAVATGRAAASATGTGPAWWLDFATKEAAIALEFAAKLAVISSQTYARGGAIPAEGGDIGGRPHSAGGTKFIFGGIPREAELDELMVINKRSAKSQGRMTVTGTPRQIASAINEAGGGVTFAPGAKVFRFDYGGSLGRSLPAPYFPASSSQGGGDSAAMLSFARAALDGIAAVNSRFDRMTVSIDPNSISRSVSENDKYLNVGRL
jgi:hypothetical protein